MSSTTNIPLSFPLHVVLIGKGQIASAQHIPVIRGRSDIFSLDAIVDVNLASAAKNGDENIDDDILYFLSLTEAINELPNLNVAIITCPPKFAQEYATTCLGFGMHVMMEKPPGLDHHNLMKLLSSSSSSLKTNQTLFTACHSVMCPQMSNVKDWIKKKVSTTTKTTGKSKDDGNNNNNTMVITSIKIEWKESAQKWHPGQTWIQERSGLGVLDILFNPLSMIDYMFEEENNNEGRQHGGEVDDVSTIVGSHTFHIESSSSTLDIPTNWTSPIAGETKLTLSFKEGHYLSSSLQPPIPIYCEYAWNYEGEDIWNITIHCMEEETIKNNDGDSNSTATTTSTAVMQLNDGGSKLIILDGKGNQQQIWENNDDDNSNNDILRPEYEALYNRFLDLINNGKSEVRQTPLQIINEILDVSSIRAIDPYDL